MLQDIIHSISWSQCTDLPNIYPKEGSYSMWCYWVIIFETWKGQVGGGIVEHEPLVWLHNNS